MSRDTSDESAQCRACGKLLRGEPYWRNAKQYACDPESGKAAKINHYGGFVCSSRCDYQASLELERSMPGHWGQTTLSQNSAAHRAWQANWGADQ